MPPVAISMPGPTMVMLPPSRPSLGLRTYSVSSWGSSRYAGSRFGWPGYISHSTARMALFDSSVFHSGSIHIVVGRAEHHRLPELVVQHPLPRVELEHRGDGRFLQIDEALQRGVPAHVLDLQRDRL